MSYRRSQQCALLALALCAAWQPANAEYLQAESRLLTQPSTPEQGSVADSAGIDSAGIDSAGISTGFSTGTDAAGQTGSGPARAQEPWRLSANGGEDRNLDDIAESGYIEIGIYRDFPPYSYLDEDGNAAGLDVKVGQLIADGLEVEPRWFWMTADETLEDDLRNNVWKGSLLDRTVADVMLRVPYDREYSYAIDGYGLPKHDNVVMFGPYHAESWVIARDLERTGAVRNLALFRYQKIGVEIDSLPDLFLSGAFNGQLRDNVTHYMQIFGALDALAGGAISAVAGMRSQVEWGLRDYPGRYDVDDDGLESLARSRWDIGAAVKHTHRQLGYAIEGALEDAVRDGRMQAIFEQAGVSYLQPSLYSESD